MDFSALKGYVENIDKNMVPSCRVSVYRDNEKLFEHFSARDDVFEAEKDKELYYLFSMSKVITCTAAMRLIEEGKLSLNDPVSKYLPEFGELYVGEERRPAQNTLTVEHILTMQGGLTYNISHPEIVKVKNESNNKATTREIMGAIAKMPLLFEAGTNYNYSLCHDVVAAVVEVVSGMSFYEYLNEIIFKPLGMKDTYFKPKSDTFERMHAQYRVAPDRFCAVKVKPECPYTITDNYESGGAGLISSIHDYAVFADCLASGTSKDGYRILKPETIELMRSDFLSGESKKYFDNYIGKPGYSYGLGVRTMVDKQKGHSLSSIGEFGWDGAAAAYVMIDPDKRLSVVYTQHVLGCGYAYSHIHTTVRNLVYEALGLA